MKVLFDSGASISLITKKGISLIPHINIKSTNISVWAANNQKIKLQGEVILRLDFNTPLLHRFLITNNTLSGCHALLGTDIYPKLDTFLLAGVKNVGLALSLNGHSYSLFNASHPLSTYNISQYFTSYHQTTTHTQQPLNTPNTSNHFAVFKLLDEDFESQEEIRPISELNNGFIPDIPNVNTNTERSILFDQMLTQLDLSHLSDTMELNIRNLLRSVNGLFITTPDDPVGLIPNCIVPINTKPGGPVRSKLRKYSPQLAAKIKQMNQSMLKRGIIEKSTSEWSNPVVLVKKPDSSTALRMCLDLRSLNTLISFDSYPIPDLKTILQTVSGYTYYTTLDISEAYFCMLIDPKDRFKLAYRTPDGLFQFCRLPFGILTGCALWNRAFQEIIEDLGDNVKSYFDDLILFHNNENTHFKCLTTTLLTLLKSGLRIKLSKCQLVRRTVKFLGFTISAKGSSPTPDGVTAVQSLKRPETLKQLRSFLGAINYFRDYIPSFAQIALPLYDLTKKRTRYKWDETTNSAWLTLKSTLSSNLILIPPDPSKSFFIATDATQTAIAAVLLQRKNDTLRPIEYFSRRLKPAESRYHTNETEGLAIFASVKRWQHYLLMNEFIILTDNSSMTHLFNRKESCNARVARWQVFIASFRYRVIHIKGRDNHLPDLLSRNVDFDQLETHTNHQQETVFTLNLPTAFSNKTSWMTITPPELRSYQELDPQWNQIIQFLEDSKSPKHKLSRPKIPCLSDFTLNDVGILCVLSSKDKQLTLKPAIPKNCIPMVLSFLHDSEWAGHPSPRKTRLSALSKFYWPTIIHDTLLYAKSCTHCQRYFEITRYYPDVIGNNKIIPEYPNEALSIDILYMQPASTGDKYILSIMDMFSRFTIFYPIRDMYANTISSKLSDYCCDYGFPKLIFTDDATNLSSALTKNIFSVLRVNHSVSIPYRHNPSMVERIHYPLKKGLSIMCEGAERSWPKYLKKLTYALNTTHNGSLGCSPMEAFFMRQHSPQPNIGNLNLTENCDPDMVHEIKHLREIMITLSLENKSKYIENRNKYTKPLPQLSLGDIVMSKRESFQEGINRKMQPIRLGPWTVSKIQGSEIQITLNENHSVIRRRHISHLAPFIDRPRYLTPNPVNITPLNIDPMEPQIIVLSIPSPFPPKSVLAVGIDCHLRKAAGLSKLILDHFPYGSMYTSSSQILNPTPTELSKLLRIRPPARRTPGKCFLKPPKTRSNGPTIANLTIQYFPGKSIDNNGIQKEYIQENKAFTDQTLLTHISSDTTSSRLQWFESSLNDLYTQLQSLDSTPNILFIPEKIGCGYAAGNKHSYWNTIKHFTSKLNTLGIQLIAITKPPNHNPNQH